MSHGKVLLVASGRSEGDKVETQHVSCNFSCTKLGWFLAYEGATKWVNILKNLFKSLENYHRYQIIIIKKTQTKVTTKNTQTTVQNKYSSIALRVALTPFFLSPLRISNLSFFSQHFQQSLINTEQEEMQELAGMVTNQWPGRLSFSPSFA